MSWYEKSALRRFYEATFGFMLSNFAFLATIDLLKDNYGILSGGINGVNDA